MHLRDDHSHFPEQEQLTITVVDIQERVSDVKSWTAPGLDMIHTYWLKKLTAPHESLAAQTSRLLMVRTHPDWLIQGRTVLIMRDS